jgi:hypothetical protein
VTWVELTQCGVMQLGFCDCGDDSLGSITAGSFLNNRVSIIYCWNTLS